ncbi:hypothetical protein P154DRAFT_517155 [Amniculicola lignicola CBS 123094]|uniref:DUF2293 domain-containing protein n=1 Tax=Amniculicola lignicola CBS 123094 TaxID=1392246 RepID=A0A6A5X3C3_9PLEO|nr:hypothetical protein P154DRAFT_517155 [Amniculicola lignicola CBS 123094]
MEEEKRGFTQKRWVHTDSEGVEGGDVKSEDAKIKGEDIKSEVVQGEDVKSDDKTPPVKRQSPPTNQRGEEIVFQPCWPPPGYQFVPSGRPWVTWRCRKLAEKLFVVYHPRSRRKLGGPVGLHVPREVAEQASEEFEAKRESLSDWLLQDLGEKYPKMPPADKVKLHEKILQGDSEFIGKKAVRYDETMIMAHIRDHHTIFKSLVWKAERTGDREKIARARQRVRYRVAEILAIWRGEL